MVATVDRVVDRPLDEDRDRQREPGKDERAAEPDRDQPPLGPPEGIEVAQSRPELEIGRIDVLHARVGLLAAGVAGHAVGGTRAVTPAWLARNGVGEQHTTRSGFPRRLDSALYQH